MNDEKQVIKAVLAYEEACRQLPSIIAELVDVHKWPMERIADFCERSPGISSIFRWGIGKQAQAFRLISQGRCERQKRLGLR